MIEIDDYKKSFEPLVSNDAKILILGSIPGDKSIELQQYYGHAQNRFWRVMADITNSEFTIDYEARKSMLIRNGFALWDVANKAFRKGSMDSAIRNETPNDIDSFIDQHKDISLIAFNGKKAEQLYDKYFKRKDDIKYLSMPSTSPANATMRLEDLCKHWRQLIYQK